GLQEWKRAEKVVAQSSRDRLSSARPGRGSSGPRKERGWPRSASRLWLLAPVFPVFLAAWISLGGRKSAPPSEPAPASIATTAGAIDLGGQQPPGPTPARVEAPKDRDPSEGGPGGGSQVATPAVPSPLVGVSTSPSAPAAPTRREAAGPRPESD